MGPNIAAIFFDIGDTLVRTNTKEWLPGAKDMLTRIRLPGVRIGIISNTPDLDREQLKAKYLPPDFDFGAFDSELVLLSNEVGIEKSDIRIFLRAIEKAAASPWACIFVGEKLEETWGAQKAGMRAVRVAGELDLAELPKVLT